MLNDPPNLKSRYRISGQQVGIGVLKTNGQRSYNENGLKVAVKASEMFSESVKNKIATLKF
jgi:hypothetical protein